MSVHDHDDQLAPVPGEPLDRDACLTLLRSAQLGRVGLSVDALPVIVPVGFSLVGERIIFGAQADPRAVAAIDGVIVAFQADAWDPCTGSGWSVLVQGPARRLVDRADLGLLTNGNGVPDWIAEASDVVVMATTVISGCRLVAAVPGEGIVWGTSPAGRTSRLAGDRSGNPAASVPNVRA